MLQVLSKNILYAVQQLDFNVNHMYEEYITVQIRFILFIHFLFHLYI